MGRYRKKHACMTTTNQTMPMPMVQMTHHDYSSRWIILRYYSPAAMDYYDVTAALIHKVPRYLTLLREHDQLAKSHTLLLGSLLCPHCAIQKHASIQHTHSSWPLCTSESRHVHQHAESRTKHYARTLIITWYRIAHI